MGNLQINFIKSKSFLCLVNLSAVSHSLINVSYHLRRGYQTIRHTICGYQYPTYSINICWTIIIEVQCHVHLSYSYLGTVWWNVCIPWIPVARVCWLIIEMIFRDWDQFRTNLEQIWNKILDNSHKQKYVSRWLTAKATANFRSYLWLLG